MIAIPLHSPSFITISSQVLPTVQDIIEDILNSSVAQGEEDNLVPPAKVTRRNTSTDNNFLASSPVEQHRPVHFNWPPRFPSQEPEDYSQINYPPLELREQAHPGIEEEEVFETDQEKHSNSNTMDPAEYEGKHRVIKLASKKVQDVKKRFLAVNVTSIHIHTYESRLKEIRDKLDTFDDATADLLVDLNEENADDKVRIDSLEAHQAQLLEEVLKNEREVEEKVKGLMESQPLTKAEEENIELQKKKLRLVEKTEEDEKILKGKKAEITMRDLSSKIANLMDTVKKVKPAADLSDQEINYIFPEAKKWENKLEELAASKVKLDIELLGLNTDEIAENLMMIKTSKLETPI